MSDPEPRIRTTVVGSYPVPDWLVASPSQQALVDATRAVLAVQVRHLDADVVQLDEANLPGHPHEWRWAADAKLRALVAGRDLFEGRAGAPAGGSG